MSNAIMSSLMPSPCIDGANDYTKFAGKSWQEKLDICNECYCCERHNISRPRYVLPTVHEFDAIDVLDTTTEVWRLGLCKCKCRFLARRMCEEDNYEIMCASPSPSDLPMPPQKWLKKENADELSLLDWATDEALEYYWKDQVKACQYAIFHMC
jgi:hypothetical protein